MHTDPHGSHHPVHQHPGTPPHDSEAPGYETTDANVGGVIVFLAALLGFVAVFFVFCLGMGKVINQAIQKQDGPPNAWHQSGSPSSTHLQNLATNPEMEQKELQKIVATFPAPRLQTDDGAQEVADLHAREDLLLEHYSSVDQSKGTIRIPIERAMQLVAQRGIPVAPAVGSADSNMTGDVRPTVQTPLTNGFARTGFEQAAIQAREDRLKMMHPNAEQETHAELAPVR